MIITNKLNLPEALVKAAADNHEIEDKCYSVTTILSSVRQILLTRRHYDEIEQDVSDMIPAIFGTAVHKLLELNDETGNAELKLKSEVIDGYYLTGITDLYNENTFTIEDYKTSSVNKVLKQDFDDWYKQGCMYAWLLNKKGLYTGRIRFHNLMKDYSRFQAMYSQTYPQTPVYTYEKEIGSQDLTKINDFIVEKFKAIIKAEKLKDDDLPMCSMEERWNDGDKYAVKKIGNKRAIKVCDSMEEAQSLLQPGYEIEERPGEDKKCLHYCPCNKFCKYYAKNYIVKNTNI